MGGYVNRTKIAQLYADAESLGGQTVTVAGWARTIRDMKNFGFVELNDGSCFRNLQVVMSADELHNYKEIASQNVGAALIVRGTVVLTPDNKRVTVPNGSLTNAAITNYSAEGQRRVELTFSVSYDCDIDKVKQILLSVAESDPKSLKDPAPLARMKTQSASSLDFVLRVWCAPENYWDLYFDLNENVKKALDEAGMEIPFPQMDVHLTKE